MIDVAAAILLHAATALLIVALCSLIGFAAMPPALRPRRVTTALPASLSIGTLLAGWSAWIAGTLIGTAAILPLFGILSAIALLRVRQWMWMCRRFFRVARMVCAANPLLTTALALVTAIILPLLLIPVVDSDGLHYHLAMPKLYLMAGRVFFYRYDVMAALPQTAEMLYLIGLRVAGAETAKFIHAFFFLATLPVVAMLASMDRRARRVAMLAPLLYAAAPVVLAPAGAAFDDHIAMFHVAVAALLLFRRAPMLLAGCALGAAYVTKTTTAPVVAALVLYALATRPRQWLSLLAPMVIAFAPFAVNTTAHLGDPIFPYGHLLLRQPVEGAPDAITYNAHYHLLIPGPLAIPWFPEPQHAPTDEVAGMHHILGFFAVVLAIRNRRIRPWLLLVAPWVVAGLFYHPSTRYFMSLFVGLALFETAAVAYLPRRWAAVAGIIAVVPAAAIAADYVRGFHASDYLLGRISREAYLAAHVPGFRAAQVVNTLPLRGTVMALDFPCPFYLDRPWIAEGVLNWPPLSAWLGEARTADDILARLRALDVHVLVVTPGYGGGTRASLFPLARNVREARIIAALRTRLRLVRTVDNTDIVVVP